MTDKELKRLNRSELLEMLIAQIEANEHLQKQLEQMQAKLDERRIIMDRAGSIAEAALQLNGIFEVAQAAAQQYLDSVRALCEESAPEKAALVAEENEQDEETTPNG